eukprot:1353222-Amorphochlora_amoeboformis.AAC.2
MDSEGVPRVTFRFRKCMSGHQRDRNHFTNKYGCAIHPQNSNVTRDITVTLASCPLKPSKPSQLHSLFPRN